jgi:hypothetical protein
MFMKASLRRVQGSSFSLTLAVENTVGDGLGERRAAVAHALRDLRIAAGAVGVSQHGPNFK